MLPQRIPEMLFSPCLTGLTSRVRGIFLAVILLGGGAGPLAQAQDSQVAESPKNSFQPERVWGVSFSTDPRQAADVPKIVWKTGSSRVTTRTFGGNVDSTAHLEGELPKADAGEWRIFWQDREFTVGAKGAFQIEVPYDSDLKTLELMAVSKGGEVEYHFYRMTVSVSSDKAGGKPSDAPADPAAFKKKIDKRFFFTPGLGVTLIDYNQTGFDPYSATVLTAKVSANYLLVPPTWDLGTTAFATALTASHSGSTSVRFIGFNLRLGYIFPRIKDPWRLALYGGWYYSTMLASDETFGYVNVSGPQLFPTLRRTFSNGQALTGYFKFSPVSSALSLMSLSNNEIAGGLAYLIPTKSRNYSISIDYARLSLAIDGGAITSSNITMGGGMSL